MFNKSILAKFKLLGLEFRLNFIQYVSSNLIKV